MDKIELILHPIRMRIIMAVAGHVLAPQQIAARLPDVAQTTLYRHLNLLIEGGILAVVRETRVRGAVEREVSLPQGAARIDPQTVATLPPDEQLRYFMIFISTLLRDFSAAQQSGNEGIPAALYTKQRLHASPEELEQIIEQTDAILRPYTTEARPTPTPAQRPWLFSGIVMPDADPQPDPEEDSQ